MRTLCFALCLALSGCVEETSTVETYIVNPYAGYEDIINNSVIDEAYLFRGSVGGWQIYSSASGGTITAENGMMVIDVGDYSEYYALEGVEQMILDSTALTVIYAD